MSIGFSGHTVKHEIASKRRHHFCMRSLKTRIQRKREREGTIEGRRGAFKKYDVRNHTIQADKSLWWCFKTKRKPLVGCRGVFISSEWLRLSKEIETEMVLKIFVSSQHSTTMVYQCVLVATRVKPAIVLRHFFLLVWIFVPFYRFQK